ncbi:MAG: hypothetical protein AABY22_32615 [Nanoarchaeota archaeon]
MAKNQYGEIYYLSGKHPRKQLLEKFSRKRASKIYVDTKSGAVKHIGWIIGGQWLRVFRVTVKINEAL